MDEVTKLKKKLQEQEPPSIETMTPKIARINVGAYYDFQEVRISKMNQVRDVVRKKREGIPFDEKEEEKDEDGYAEEYKDENLPDLIEAMFNGEDEKFNEQDVHDEFTQEEYDYLKNILDSAELAKKLENSFKGSMSYFKQEPIYQQFLKYVRGIGPVMTANLILRIEYCEDSGPHVSNLWSYAGLAPGQKLTKGEQAGFNKKLRTLCWKISEQMIRGKSLYRQYFYDPYRGEQEKKRGYSDARHEGEEEKIELSDITEIFDIDEPFPKAEKYVEGWNMAVEGKEFDYDGSAATSTGHTHNRSKRYMVKKFLKHYWVIARTLKGLEVTDPWPVKVGDHEKREDSPENPFWMLNTLRENNG